MPKINPGRNYSEHDVINGFFTISGAVPVNRGTIVYITSGFYSDRSTPLGVGSPGATYPNTVNPRYVLPANVAPWATTGSPTQTNDPIGITLLDVKEVDENGERMILHPQNQWERGAVLSGQAVPIATRGVFHYSGIDPNSTVQGGTRLYATGSNTAGGNLYGLTATVCGNSVGRALGPKDSNGFAWVQLNFEQAQ